MFFVGGQQIYREALEIADRIYLTLVHARCRGDAHFPEIPAAEVADLLEQEHHQADRTQ